MDERYGGRSRPKRRGPVALLLYALSQVGGHLRRFGGESSDALCLGPGHEAAPLGAVVGHGVPGNLVVEDRTEVEQVDIRQTLDRQRSVGRLCLYHTQGGRARAYQRLDQPSRDVALLVPCPCGLGGRLGPGSRFDVFKLPQPA